MRFLSLSGVALRLRRSVITLIRSPGWIRFASARSLETASIGILRVCDVLFRYPFLVGRHRIFGCIVPIGRSTENLGFTIFKKVVESGFDMVVQLLRIARDSPPVSMFLVADLPDRLARMQFRRVFSSAASPDARR